VTATSEILLFQVGVRIFATAVKGAVRIGSVRDVPAETLMLDSALGRPFSRERGIVVATDDEHPERTLVIDQVLGVQTVGEAELRPLPAFAAACLPSGAVTGFVLLDQAPLPLVDLPTVVREQLARPIPRI
jgi:chemotaxis signal transduction protein